MAVQPLYGVPPKAILPLVKGEDVDVDFIYKPMVLNNDGTPHLISGAPHYAEDDFPEGAVLALIIEPNIRGDAIIEGSHGKVNIDHTRIDRVRAGSLWRLVLTIEGIDRVLLNGSTTRSDGA